MIKKQIKRSPIEEWELHRITPYENNAKLHPDTHVEQIASSIEEFTFLDPVAVDETGCLLEGHGRLLAAKRRGDATIPVIVVSGLTETQKVAYRLAHNKLTVNTGFDPELLAVDFDFLKGEDFDLNLTGFDPIELNFEEEVAPLVSKMLAEGALPYQNKYAIAIECKDEQEQERTYNLLKKQGYKCKVLTL